MKRSALHFATHHTTLVAMGTGGTREHDVSSKLEIINLTSSCSITMKLGSHSHIFCSKVQISDCLRVLHWFIEFVQCEDRHGKTITWGKRSGSETKLPFYVSGKAPSMLKKRTEPCTTSTRKSMRCIYGAGNSTLLVFLLKSKFLMGARYNFIPHQVLLWSLAFRRSASWNMIFFLRQFYESNALYAAPGTQPLVHIHYILRTCSYLRLQAFDSCLTGGAGSNLCLWRNNHFKFVSCNMNRESAHKMNTSFLHLFPSQFLDRDTDINKKYTINEGESISTGSLAFLSRRK